MKNILLAFPFLTLIACDSSQKATGHWHIYRENDRFKTIYLMDVGEDSVAYYSDPLYGKNEGYYDARDRVLAFPGDCGSMQFKYSITGKSIYLYNEYGNWRGEKCGDKCCTPIEDFKINLKFDIQFPQVQKMRDSLRIVEFENDRYKEPVILGKLKPEFDYFYEDEEILLELGGKLAEKKHIGDWLAKERSRLREQEQRFLSFKFIVDKDISLKDLKPIVEEFRKHDAPKIWITCLKPDYINQEEMFEHVRVVDIDLNQDLTLSEVLN